MITRVARPGPAAYHSLGTVFIIVAIICLCKGFHARLNRLSPKERNAARATSLSVGLGGGKTPPETPV